MNTELIGIIVAYFLTLVLAIPLGRYIARVFRGEKTWLGFLAHNPGTSRADIPSELVTVSGSGPDPEISVAAALVQVPRIAVARRMPEAKLKELVERQTQGPLLGLLGPGNRVHVLQLNLALDEMK